MLYYVSNPTFGGRREAQIGNEVGYFGQNEPKIFDRMPDLKAKAQKGLRSRPFPTIARLIPNDDAAARTMMVSANA